MTALYYSLLEGSSNFAISKQLPNKANKHPVDRKLVSAERSTVAL